MSRPRAGNDATENMRRVLGLVPEGEWVTAHRVAALALLEEWDVTPALAAQLLRNARRHSMAIGGKGEPALWRVTPTGQRFASEVPRRSGTQGAAPDHSPGP